MTLGEVLMGLALLSMVLVMAAVVLQWALQGSQAQQNKTVAAFLAQQQMEELMATPEPRDDKGVFTTPHQDFSWTSQVQALEKEPFLDLTVTVQGPRGARYRLKAQRRKNLRTLVYRSSEQLIRSSEDLRETEVLADGLGKWGFSVAPGGQTLAFVAIQDGLPQIFTRSLPGDEATILLKHPGGAQEPCYSPDGQKLAFTAQEDGVSKVFVWDLTRRNWLAVSHGGHQESSPCWTPDSRGLIICRDQSALVLLRDGAESVLVESESGWNAAPDLSPDGGNRLVFMSNRDGNPEIYLLEIASKRVKRLTDNPAYDSQPRFSVDGKRIVFSSRGEDGVSRLFSMNTDGTRLSPLTPDSSGEDPQWER